MDKNHIDLESGELRDYREKVVRRASDMRGFFHDSEALEKMIGSGDPIIYEVFAVNKENEGELSYAVTRIYPGKVGDEFFMTKGHYHKKRDRAEIYIGIGGYGILLMQRESEVRWVEMRRGDMVYVPPHWAHRSVNTGNEDFLFLAIYPGDAGHDYGSIAETGFAKIVLERDGKYDIVNNPKFV